MEKKLWTALALCGAATVSYSFVPSQAGKIKEKYNRQRRRSDKVLYLTFDDGPHPVYTAKLLDLLAEHKVKATFFVVGKFAEENPQLIKRMEAEGHAIGLHSYAHTSAMVQSPKQAAEDLQKGRQALASLGISTNLYRPPWGHVNWFTLRELKACGMKKVLWNVMAEDWEENTDETEIQYKLLKRTRPGDIICLHDRQADSEPLEHGEEPPDMVQLKEPPEQMLAALEKTLPLWLSEGYEFQVIREA